MVVARTCRQDGSAAATYDVAGTGTAWSACPGAAARGFTGPGAGSAGPTGFTTSQAGPHQSASTSQAGGSGWDVTAGMGQQSTRAGPISTGMAGCALGTTVRDGHFTPVMMRVTEPIRPADRQTCADAVKTAKTPGRACAGPGRPRSGGRVMHM